MSVEVEKFLVQVEKVEEVIREEEVMGEQVKVVTEILP